MSREIKAPETTDPKKVLSISPVTTYVCRYSDAEGNVHTGLVHDIGGGLYMHPTDEKWVNSLKHVTDWFGEVASKKISAAERGELKRVMKSAGLLEEEGINVPEVNVDSGDKKKK